MNDETERNLVAAVVKLTRTIDHHTEVLMRLANNMNQRLQAIEEQGAWVNSYRAEVET